MNIVSKLISKLINEFRIIITESFLKYFASLVVSFDVNKLFEGKRVAIIGPADSAMRTGLGSYIDQFDVVVRINNSPIIVANSRNAVDVGSRTDVLFHCLQEADGKLGGRLDFDLLKNQGVESIVSYVRINESIHNYWIVNYCMKYINKLKNKLFLVPAGIYKELYTLLGNKKPTTGMVAIFMLFKVEFKELYISGFTFYQTGYMNGYTVGLDNSLSEKIDVNKPMGSHGSPMMEFQLFKDIFHKSDKNVKLDKFLYEICFHGK